jgi:hypothetical protein
MSAQGVAVVPKTTVIKDKDGRDYEIFFDKAGSPHMVIALSRVGKVLATMLDIKFQGEVMVGKVNGEELCIEFDGETLAGTVDVQVKAPPSIPASVDLAGSRYPNGPCSLPLKCSECGTVITPDNVLHEECVEECDICQYCGDGKCPVCFSHWHCGGCV